MASLQMLIDEQAMDPINTAEDFGIYHQSFLTMASFLKNKSQLSDREISFYFLQGLHPSLRAKVQGQLQVEDPKHHTDDPYSLPEISTTALFILSCNHAKEPKREASELSIKKKHFDFLKIDHNFLKGNISALVTEIVKQLNAQPTTAQGTQGMASTTTQQIRNICCVFCSELGHFLKGCTGKLDRCMLALEYIQKGLYKEGKNRQIVLLNGEKNSCTR